GYLEGHATPLPFHAEASKGLAERLRTGMEPAEASRKAIQDLRQHWRNRGGAPEAWVRLVGGEAALQGAEAGRVAELGFGSLLDLERRA
ncbi:MAG: hypothetical protein KDI19_17280, partial [Pseudomonadales bacterium]|nr:hypothetical protein [Pseudomonadales bacterium]